MILPEIIADLESASKCVGVVINSLPDEFRRRKLELAQRKIIVSVDYLRRMTVGDLTGN